MTFLIDRSKLKLFVRPPFQVQFVAIFTHQFQLLWTDCEYPKGFMVWIGLHGVMFLFLFSDFYKQNYIERQKRLKDARRASTNGKAIHFDDDNGAGSVS